MKSQAIKEHMNSIKSEDVLVPTTDDWYPNYEGNKVQVSIMPLIPRTEDEKLWRVCVWGADDCGMEYDTDDKHDAMVTFDMLKHRDFITKAGLLELGFNFA